MEWISQNPWILFHSSKPTKDTFDTDKLEKQNSFYNKAQAA
jgi:hypothetical protein